MMYSMGLFYVTGIAGSGKSEVCKELTKLGYEAHEGDDKLSAFYNNETDQVVERPAIASDRTYEWRQHHTWKMSRDKLVDLKKRAQGKPVFVCGVASNEEDYIDVFDKVFTLVVDNSTLISRIETRGADAFGANSLELETLLEWQKTTEAYYQKIGAKTVDATKQVSEVAAEIVASI